MLTVPWPLIRSQRLLLNPGALAPLLFLGSPQVGSRRPRRARVHDFGRRDPEQARSRASLCKIGIVLPAASKLTNPPAVFSIVISEKGGAERRQFFDQSGVSVGRVQGNDLVLPKGNVSKRHCRVEVVEGQFFVTDQGSTNGTYLNRRRIAQSTAVRQGDRIYVGDFVLRIEEGASDGATMGPSGPPQPAPVGGALATGETPGVPRPDSVRPPGASVSQPPPKIRASAQAPDVTPSMQPASSGRISAPGGQALGGQALGGQALGGQALGGQQARDTSAPVQSAQISSGRRALSTTQEEDSSLPIVAPTAFVVERVAAQVNMADLSTPQAVSRVENLIEQVYGELQRDSGPLPPVVGQQIRMAARAELLEFGPLGALLDDPAVNEIAASGAGQLTVIRGSQQSQSLPFCASGSLERAVERLCASEGVPLAPAEQSARRQLVSCGFDLELLRGAISPHGGVLRLRRRDRVAVGLEDLVRLGTVSRGIATLLQQCVLARANILVVGGPRSGASEVTAALATSAPGDRALMLSHTEELADADGRIMPVHAGADGQLSDILAQLASLPGHRLVVDDLLRGERGVATLQTVFEGADGVIARLGARSVERGIAQLCAHTAMMRPGLNVATVADAVIAAFDLVLEVGRLRDTRSRVLRVAELRAGDALPVAADDIFTFSVERVATGGAVEGSFNATGLQPRFAAELKTRGVRVDSGIFGRAKAPYPNK